jgi:hypothetical protein
MTTEQREVIIAHGRSLLAIFPNAIETDPLTLCKRLRRIEVRANNAACAACNHQAGADAWERESEKASTDANRVLGTDRVWVNGDPRGYALKIDLQPGEHLHRDWGGYGIIAPEIGPDGR